MKKWMKDNQKIIVSTLIFLTAFVLLTVYKNLPNFTDEADNMLAAMKIAHGGNIYLDYYAHHMPLMYYILTPFAMLGVASTYAYRLCFYGILALIWAFMYYRYSEKIDKRLLIIYPILYIVFMANGLNYTIVAEHLQTQALVILLLELIIFSKTKKLTLSSEVIIAICIFSSIFSVFSSSVSIGILALVVIAIELKQYFNKKGKKMISFFSYLLKKYKRLIVFICLPFLLIIIYYCINGSIKEFYRQAFYFNTEIYANYQSYPSNPLLIIIYTISNYFSSIKDHFLLLFSTLSIESILELLFLIGPIIYLVTEKDKNKYLIFAYVIFCGNRSFTGFHSIPYYGCAIILTFIATEKWKKEYSIGLITFCLTAYMPYLPKLAEPLNNVKEINNNYDYMTVQSITEHENDVYYLNLMIENYVNTNRLPATRAMTIFPWFQDMFEDELLDDLKKNRPKVIAYAPTANVWEYVYQDYLEKIDPYIKENYTYANMIRIGYDYNTWIRNDYVEEVEKKLNIQIPDYTNSYGNLVELPATTNIVSQLKFEQNHIDKIELKFNTYNRLNFSKVKIVLKNNDQKEVYSKTISASEIPQNSVYELAMDIDVDTEKTYILEISNEEVFENNFVGLYGITLKKDNNENYIVLNNQKSDYELYMNIYYSE